MCEGESKQTVLQRRDRAPPPPFEIPGSPPDLWDCLRTYSILIIIREQLCLGGDGLWVRVTQIKGYAPKKSLKPNDSKKFT